MPQGVALGLSLLALAGALGAAVARVRWAPEWVVSVIGAGVLVGAGAVGWSGARRELAELGPTIGFLAALLVLAEGCRRLGLFDWLAGRLGGGAFGAVFLVATLVTVVLGLDATVVLLTPIVVRAVARSHARGGDPRRPLLACAHLANGGSLLLPVSNLTNLLAFRASGLSFARFGELMALPWLCVLAIEWVGLRRAPLAGAGSPASAHMPASADPPASADRAATRAAGERAPLTPGGRYALAVLGVALVAFGLSSLAGVAPVWVAVAAAALVAAPTLRGRDAPSAFAGYVRAAQPGFLVLVAALGVIVAAAEASGLRSAAAAVLPSGHTLPDLLLVAAVSAAAANLLNNLPATLLLLPVTAGLGPGGILAMLVGVGVGPNLTYAGSLATLLWRRLLASEPVEISLADFTRLGLLTVPAGLVVATVAVWVSVRVL